VPRDNPRRGSCGIRSHKGGKLSEDQESASNFIVCFLTVDGKGLTIIGPPDAVEALETRLKDAAEVELHRFHRASEIPSP
jgi:hypothetical protein